MTSPTNSDIVCKRERNFSREVGENTMSEEKGRSRNLQEIMPSAEEVQRELAKAKNAALHPICHPMQAERHCQASRSNKCQTK
jgi:hypothetical protein